MKKIKNKLLYIKMMFLVAFFLACNKNDKEEVNFSRWKNNQFNKSFIKFDEDSVKFYDGPLTSENYMIGVLEYQDNVIFFKSKQLKFKLFDFNLVPNQCISIIYKKSSINQKQYQLCNQDVFFDKARNDTIYKFCFKNYNIISKNDGVVYFVSKYSGVLGCYLVDYSNAENMPMINQIMYGDIFPERYDYSKSVRFTIK